MFGLDLYLGGQGAFDDGFGALTPDTEVTTTGGVLAFVGMTVPPTKWLLLDATSLYLRSVDLELRCG